MCETMKGFTTHEYLPATNFSHRSHISTMIIIKISVYVLIKPLA